MGFLAELSAVFKIEAFWLRPELGILFVIGFVTDFVARGLLCETRPLATGTNRGYRTPFSSTRSWVAVSPSMEFTLTDRHDEGSQGDTDCGFPLTALITDISDDFLLLSRSRDRRLSMALLDDTTSLLLRRTVGLSKESFRWEFPRTTGLLGLKRSLSSLEGIVGLIPKLGPAPNIADAFPRLNAGSGRL